MNSRRLPSECEGERVGPKRVRRDIIQPVLSLSPFIVSSSQPTLRTLPLPTHHPLYLSFLPPLTKPWSTLHHPSGISPVHPLVSPKYKTTTFSLSSRSSSTRTHLLLPMPFQHPTMVSTLPRSPIYQRQHHPPHLATRVAPALPAQPNMPLPLVASQPLARPSRTVMNSSARQVQMSWRRIAQIKSLVRTVSPECPHPLIEALSSAKKSPARRKSGTSQVSATPHSYNIIRDR